MSHRTCRSSWIWPASPNRATTHHANRREEVYEIRRVTALIADSLDTILLGKGLELANERDIETGLLGNLHGVVTDILAYRPGAARASGQPAPMDAQPDIHRTDMADVRERACQNDPVKT